MIEVSRLSCMVSFVPRVGIVQVPLHHSKHEDLSLSPTSAIKKLNVVVPCLQLQAGGDSRIPEVGYCPGDLSHSLESI